MNIRMLWLTLFNKAIWWWLKYCVHCLNSHLKPLMDPEKNPYAALLTKLSRIEPPWKKAHQGFQQYMHECLNELQPKFDDAWNAKKEAGLQPNDQTNVNFCATIARQEFNKLSAAQRKQYEANTQAEKVKDAEWYKVACADAMKKTPVNRLKYVQPGKFARH